MKKIPCLLALALFGGSLQACLSRAEKSDTNAQQAAQYQASPQPGAPPASETAVPAPSKFDDDLTGSIGNHAVSMSLKRDGADLTGNYSYDRAGAFNGGASWLDLKGRIDAAGNVTLTETIGEIDDPRKTGEKTGEFIGKLDGLSANGKVDLRFSGAWTGKDGMRLPFNLRQLRFDLGGLEIVSKKIDSANKKLNYKIEIEAPRLAGAASALSEKFDKAVADVVAARVKEFKEDAADLARNGVDNQAGCLLEISYKTITADRNSISILFSFDAETHRAHPNSYFESLNYDLKRNEQVKLADLFAPNSKYLKVISDYSAKELKKLGVDDYLGPKLDDFHSWNITSYGLKISFDRGRIVNWAAGEFEVVVPYSLLKPIIKPDGLLGQFAK
ncbi:MAG: DUF3298 domain-containing protein [Chloracidobacterium sp.]|nr:DUF3298 domain-containing protein [Chloracidobacterium sp.]